MPVALDPMESINVAQPVSSDASRKSRLLANSFKVLVILADAFCCAGARGNPDCWNDVYSFDVCCSQSYGDSGNPDCWGPPDSKFTFLACCFSPGQLPSMEHVKEQETVHDKQTMPPAFEVLVDDPSYPIPKDKSFGFSWKYSLAFITENSRIPLARESYCTQSWGFLWVVRVSPGDDPPQRTLVCVPTFIRLPSHVQRFASELYATLPQSTMSVATPGTKVEVLRRWGAWKPMGLIISCACAAFGAYGVGLWSAAGRLLVTARPGEVLGFSVCRMCLMWYVIFLHCAQYNIWDTRNGYFFNIIVNGPYKANLWFAILSVHCRRHASISKLFETWIQLAPSCITWGYIAGRLAVFKGQTLYPELVRSYEVSEDEVSGWAYQGTLLPRFAWPGLVLDHMQLDYVDPFRMILQLQVLFSLLTFCSKRLPGVLSFVPHALAFTCTVSYASGRNIMENNASLRSVAPAVLLAEGLSSLPWLRGGRVVIFMLLDYLLPYLDLPVHPALNVCQLSLVLKALVVLDLCRLGAKHTERFPHGVQCACRALDRLTLGCMQAHPWVIYYLREQCFVGVPLPAVFECLVAIALLVALMGYTCALFEFLLLQTPIQLAVRFVKACVDPSLGQYIGKHKVV